MTSPQSVSIPLYSPQSNRSASVDFDSRLVNGFIEKSQGETGDETWIFKRPGLLLHSSVAPDGDAGLGTFNWNGHIYSVFGTLFYKDTTSKGTVDATGGSYTFVPCLGAVPKLLIKNKTHAYNYDDVNGLVAVTDTNYPAVTVRGCAYLDGTTYVMDQAAAIHGSDFNDPTTWDPLSLILVQIEPDPPQCITKQLVYVVAIKTVETEVFYDAGNGTGSPLGPVQGSKFGVGARSPESVVRTGDDLAWVGTTSEGSIQVIAMSKVHGERISTPPVERAMEHLDYSVVYAWSAKVGGHRYYVVTCKNNNYTIVFDLEANAWYRWTDAFGQYMPIVSSTFDAFANPVLQHETNGNLYTLTPAVATDDGNAYTVSIFTANVDGGLKTQKTCASVDIIADQVETTAKISWSDDDYQTYSTPVEVDLNQERVVVPDGSSFRRRSYLITHNDNVSIRFKALNLMSSAGTY